MIGVAKSVRSTYLSKEDEGYVYLPRRLNDAGALFLVRTRTLPDRSFQSLSAALADSNPSRPARTYIVSLEQGPVRFAGVNGAGARRRRGDSRAALLWFWHVSGSMAWCPILYRCGRARSESVSRSAPRARMYSLLVGSQTLRPVAWGGEAGLLGTLGVSGLLRALIAMPRTYLI